MASLRPRPLTSLTVDKLSTGCPYLDEALGGGVPCGSITEVVGEAAASKTQLSLQLLLSTQLPREYGGLDGCAVYMFTEGEPAMKRLHQLAKALPLRYPPEALANLPDPAANIFVEKGIETGPQLLARLQRLRGLLERQRRLAAAAGRGGAGGSSSSGGAGGGSHARPVRLLVVDSVAHVFRDMGDSVGVGELSGRTELLFKMSALLRRYADEFGLAVLLVNQVVDCVGDGRRVPGATTHLAAGHGAAARHAALTGGLRLVSLGREVAPALGLAWANCVNSRLFLARCAGPDGTSPALFHGAPSVAAQTAGGGAAQPALRKLQVLFSPHLPQSECYYVVESTGVRGLHRSELEQHDVAAAAAAQAAWRQQQQEQQRLAWEQQQAQRQQQAAHGWSQQPQQGVHGWQQQGQQQQQGPGGWEQQPQQSAQGWPQQQDCTREWRPPPLRQQAAVPAGPARPPFQQQHSQSWPGQAEQQRWHGQQQHPPQQQQQQPQCEGQRQQWQQSGAPQSYQQQQGRRLAPPPQQWQQRQEPHPHTRGHGQSGDGWHQGGNRQQHNAPVFHAGVVSGEPSWGCGPEAARQRWPLQQQQAAQQR